MKSTVKMFVAILFLAATALAADPPREGLDFLDTGPIRFREQFLIGLGFYAFDPASADVLDRGESRLDVVQSDTNTFARSQAVTAMLEERRARGGVTLAELRAAPADSRGGVYYIDGEVAETSVAFRRGIGRGTEIAAIVPVRRFGGGGMDGVIERFHKTFGFYQSGRTGALRNRYAVYLRDGSGREVFRSVTADSGIGDVAISVKRALPAPGKRWKVATEIVAELPTRSQRKLFSNDGIDVGTQILATRYFSTSCIHASAGVVREARSTAFGTRAQTLLSAMVAYEQALSHRTSAVAQMTISESPFRKLPIRDLSANAYLIDLGIKQAVTSKTILFFAASENVATYGSSADIGFHAGFTWTR